MNPDLIWGALLALLFGIGYLRDRQVKVRLRKLTGRVLALELNARPHAKASAINANQRPPWKENSRYEKS